MIKRSMLYEQLRQKSYEPVSAVLHVVEVPVVVHGVVRLTSVEVYLILTHPVLELDSILLGHEGSVLVVVLQVVVDLG